MTSDRIQQLAKNGGSGDGGIQIHSRTIDFDVINSYVGQNPDPISILRKVLSRVPGQEGQYNVELLCEICP